MKVLASLAIAILALGGVASAEPGTRLHFPRVGFSIAPLENESSNEPHGPLFMRLPPKDGFSANVNVEIQPFDGTMEGYADISRGQFKNAGFEIVSEKIVDGQLTFEFKGEVEGNPLHWYAKAVKRKDRILLVTATATEAQWKDVSATLKACVDSFTLDEEVQPGAARP